MLIIFNLIYANAPEDCKVLKEKNSAGIRLMDMNKSIKLCTKAIKDYPKNEVLYMEDLGSAYSYNGDLKEAIYWYTKAAENDNISAQYSLGNIHHYKKPYIDKKKAVQWYLKAAENNDDWAQVELGGMYQEGEGVKKDIKEALFWYKKASDLNNNSAQMHIGEIYYKGKDVEQDYKKAIQWYTKAAENKNARWWDDGDGNAQIKLADMYYDGVVVEKDYKKAFKWFMRAAKQGNSYAQNSIGYMYYNGKWATKNYKKAFKWYMKAAENNYTNSQFIVGFMFSNGQGTKKSYKKAMQWYVKASENNSVRAKTNIGFMYFNGWGVRKNNKKAFEWLIKAATQGTIRAQMMVGFLYYDGVGVKKDYIKAYAWLNQVLSSDIDESARIETVSIFNVLETIMTPKQIEIAQNYDPLKINKEVENKPVEKKIESSDIYTGTGFFVDKSTVLTNHHVIKNCNRIELIRKGYKSIAKVKAKDSINDLAILEADKVNNSSLNFRAGKGIRIGDDIIVIGYPLGELLGSGIKLTTGNVSALTGLINDTTSMQLTAPVQPGNSGGALLDSSGNVVGVIVARLKKEQNVNLAIKANVAQMFLDINSVDYGVSMSNDKKDVADIADEAKESTVQVVCYQ